MVRRIRPWNLLTLRVLGWGFVWLYVRYLVFYRVIAYGYFDPHGNLLAVGGVVELWPGVGEGFLALRDGKLPQRHCYRVSRLILRYLVVIVRTYDLGRVQATVRCDLHRGCKLAEFLGMHIEGELEQYGPDGQDYFIYARLLP